MYTNGVVPQLLSRVQRFATPRNTACQALWNRWPNYWSFSFSTSPSNEHSGLISFRVDWFNLLAVQGTLKCLLQHHNSKASVIRRLAFFMVQLSYPHVTTGKTTALTGWTFVAKVMLVQTVVIHFTFCCWKRCKDIKINEGRQFKGGILLKEKNQTNCWVYSLVVFKLHELF